MPTAILPFLLIALVQAKVSLDRVNKYMNNEELDADADFVMLASAAFVDLQVSQICQHQNLWMFGKVTEIFRSIAE